MHPKSIESVSKSYLCCNCGACKAVCPKDAIEFQSTSIGRVFAEVNDNCIDCGVCTKVCPTLVEASYAQEFDPFVGNISAVYVGKSTDRETFINGQSGGICTAILTYLFDSNKIDAALVCKMDYGSPVPVVRSVIVTSSKELTLTQKSCYTPVVSLGNLKDDIRNYSSVAVVGIGCQLDALVNIESLRKDIKDRIYCKIGLICDRTLCNTIQNVYASYVPKFNELLITWRCKYLNVSRKQFRYENAPLVIFDKSKNYKIFPNIYRVTLKDMFTSPRCRVCPNKLNIHSDLTLGDPWRMPDIDMENGESVIAVRTPKGKDILDGAFSSKCIEISKRPKEQLIKGQLTEERKIQVSEYAEAFHVLQPTVASTLLIPQVEVTPTGVDKAIRNLTEFRKRELKTSDAIVKEARQQVSKALLRKTVAYRILRKVFKIIWK